jgi:hypothetical protein
MSKGVISGISFYKNNCLDITYETELTMELEPDNEYDKSAISIKNNIYYKRYLKRYSRKITYFAV